MPASLSKPRRSADVSLRTLVVGCGYLGQCLAEKSVFAGQTVWATTRNPSKAAKLRTFGIESVLADWTDKRTLCDLPSVDQILVAVAYDRHRGPRSIRITGGSGCGISLVFSRPDAHVCYISTTGVYHQTDGSWVDETSPTRPNREGGQVHL